MWLSVKNPPARWEIWVRSLGWEDPLEKRMATHSSYSSLENSIGCIVHGVTKSRTRLSDFPSLPLEMLSSCLRWLPLFCPLSLHLLCLLLACLRRCWGSLQLQSQGCSSFEEFSASWSPVVSQPCSVTASEGRGEVRGNPHIFRGFSVSTALGSSWGPF